MPRTLTAYLLCAGQGSRLAPLTERLPKPLISFHGKSALRINWEKLRMLVPTQVLCNTHHLWEVVEKEARTMGMNVLYEQTILGTGGCLWNAKHILEDTDLFLVHNGDLIHDIDLTDLLRRHRESGHIATLAGLFRPAFNTLSCSGSGKLLGVHGYLPFDASEELSRLTFAGIAIYDRRFLDYLRPGAEDIKPYWMDALRDGHSIGLANYTHAASWYDFGTPQGLWEAAKWVMDIRKEYSYNYYPLLREPRPFVANEAGQDELPDMLRNVLIYEESATPIDSGTENCIVGLDFRWGIQP